MPWKFPSMRVSKSSKSLRIRAENEHKIIMFCSTQMTFVHSFYYPEYKLNSSAHRVPLSFVSAAWQWSKNITFSVDIFLGTAQCFLKYFFLYPDIFWKSLQFFRPSGEKASKMFTLKWIMFFKTFWRFNMDILLITLA